MFYILTILEKNIYCILCIVYSFCLFCGARDQILGLTHARQALDHWAAVLALSYIILHFSHNIPFEFFLA
jgi:hypothetical protein